jgi:hypothetical protein
MTLEEFAVSLHQEILVKAGDEAAPQLREEAFTEHVLGLLSEHNEVDGADLCHYEGKSLGSIPGAKLSAWSMTGDGATVDLFITLYHGSGAVVEVGKPETRRYFKLLQGFLRRATTGFHKQLDESSTAFHAMQQIAAAHELLTTVRLFFLTDGVVRSMEIDEEPFQGLEVKYTVWDLDKLSRLKVGHREVITIDFVNDYGGSIPCIMNADPTGEYRTFLAYLPANLLAQIYGEYGQRLLERNVRAFLQARGKINRGLQKTLKEEPHRFLAYNNGLCCTAADIKVLAGSDGHARIEWLKDFQIVNGGQTTASIFHAVKKEKVSVNHVTVQVKLTVLRDPALVSEVVPLISLYANSQNKVNGADFAANGRFHQTLEQLSRTVWAPPQSGLERGSHWYYERARGSYADDKGRQSTPVRTREWEAQNPASQKFAKTDLAKYEHAWLCMPHFVCLGAEKNFNKFAERLSLDGDPVVDENYFRQAVAKAIFWKTTERLFDATKLPQWRAQTVAYSIAWIASASEHRIDLDKIWREQRLFPELCDAMKEICVAAHRHICSQSGNQGESCKKEACWQAFRNSTLTIPDTWRMGLSEYRFLPATSQEEALGLVWEQVRHQFLNDIRTVGELEDLTGKKWPAFQRGTRTQAVSFYAEKSWMDLHRLPRMGAKAMRSMAELLAQLASD